MDESKLQSKLQESVNDSMSRIEKFHMRPLFRQAYSCMSNCYKDQQCSQDQLSRCVQNCSATSNTAQNIVQNEMNSFQNRLQRGIEQCQDELNDKITPEVRANPQKLEALRQGSLGCLNQCVTRHIELLKSVEGRIEHELHNIK